jgi:hypothetical protein
MFFDRGIESEILEVRIFVNYLKFGANKMIKTVNDKNRKLIHLCIIETF